MKPISSSDPGVTNAVAQGGAGAATTTAAAATNGDGPPPTPAVAAGVVVNAPAPASPAAAPAAPQSSSSSSSPQQQQPQQQPPPSGVVSRNAFRPTLPRKTASSESNTTQSAATAGGDEAASGSSSSSTANADAKNNDIASSSTVAAIVTQPPALPPSPPIPPRPDLLLLQQQAHQAKQEQRAAGRRLLALSRRVRDAAAERAALEREAERLMAAIAAEQKAMAQSKERQVELQRALEQAKTFAERERERERERGREVEARQRDELGRLAQQHHEAEEERQWLVHELQSAQQELLAKRDLCADLNHQIEALLPVRAEARDAAEEARTLAARRALKAAAWRAEANEARVKAARVRTEAQEARQAVLAVSSELEEARAERHSAVAELRRQAELLEREKSKAAAIAAALEEAQKRLAAQLEANAEPEAELQRVRAAAIAAEQRAGFLASRTDALEARCAMLVKDDARAQSQAARSAMNLERVAQWYGRVADVRERKRRVLAAWAATMRREMERRGDELEQLGAIERARWEAMAGRQRVARLQLAELARQRARVARAVAADRAAVVFQRKRLLLLKQRRRRELSGWVRLQEQAEVAAIERKKAVRRHAEAVASAVDAQHALEGESASADALRLKGFLLRRAVATAARRRADNQSRADKLVRILGLENAAAEEAGGRAKSALRNRRRAEAASRLAAKMRQRANNRLDDAQRELQQLGRETAGIEAARAQVLRRVRAARDALAAAKCAHEQAEAEAQEQEWALGVARGVVTAARDKVVAATATVDGVVAQVGGVGGG